MNRTGIKVNTIAPEITATIIENLEKFLEYPMIYCFRENVHIDLHGIDFVSGYFFSLILPYLVINSNYLLVKNILFLETWTGITK